MDANTIIHLVGSLGFPIVCCIGLGYFIIKELSEIRKSHREEIDQLRTCLENNTIAITKLIDKLDKEG